MYVTKFVVALAALALGVAAQCPENPSYASCAEYCNSPDYDAEDRPACLEGCARRC
jgi:hypothetical protein